MLAMIRERFVKAGTISPADVELLTVTDDPAVALEAIRTGMSALSQQIKRTTPSKILGERA
jgi:predicted Rossmann-fold nucleotide-binding protein